MFWRLGTLGLILYLVGIGLEYMEVIKHTPFTLLYFLYSLVGVYFLSGINVINEWGRRPVLLFGKYAKTAGPGLAWIEPAFHTILDDVSVQDVV